MNSSLLSRRFFVPALCLAVWLLYGFESRAHAQTFADIAKVSAKLDPATAAPGGTVTWKMTAKLKKGWHTYPTKQTDEKAADFVTAIKFTDTAGLKAGDIKDPPKPKTKADKDLGIKEMRYYPDEATWECIFTVPKDAKPGKKTIKATVTMQVCDEKGCLPPEDVKLEATVTVGQGKSDARQRPPALAAAGLLSTSGLQLPEIGFEKHLMITEPRLLEADNPFNPAASPKPVDKVRRGETVVFEFGVVVESGWHTYPTKQADPKSAFVTKFEFDKSLVVAVGEFEEIAERKSHQSGEYKYDIFEGPVTWKRTLVVRPDAKPGKHAAKVKFNTQVCIETCVFVTKEFAIDLTISDEPSLAIDPRYKGQVDRAIAAANANPGTRLPGKAVAATEFSEDDAAEEQSKNEGLLGFLLNAVFWAALSLLTPCVFPMIPITVSFFLKQSEQQHHRPITMATVYSLTIVVVLTIGGIVMMRALQDFIQHWATNLAIGILFLVFALSLFGMFEIRLPAALANLTVSQEARGGLIGTVFMALTFTIISFACIAPFYGSFGALAAYAQSAADWGKLVLGAVVFSVVFASPFFVLALFPTLLKSLPKSGSWMNTVKVVMAFLEVAAAIKFLRTAEVVLTKGQAEYLTFDLSLGIYVALAMACGLYLLNVFRMEHDEPAQHLRTPRLVLSLLFLSLGLYLLPGLFKNDTGQPHRPRGEVFAWVESFLLPDRDAAWIGNLDKGLKQARAERRLVFVDFTGLG